MSAPSTATVAANMAAIFGAITPPAGEDPIALATHELPDELTVQTLPALLVWPPVRTPVGQPGLDRSHLRYPVVLYLPRGTKAAKDRVASLYAWADLLPFLPQSVSSHLAVDNVPIPGVGSAGSYLVTINDPADTLYGTVHYDTVRVDVEVVFHAAAIGWKP